MNKQKTNNTRKLAPTKWNDSTVRSSLQRSNSYLKKRHRCSFISLCQIFPHNVYLNFVKFDISSEFLWQGKSYSLRQFIYESFLSSQLICCKPCVWLFIYFFYDSFRSNSYAYSFANTILESTIRFVNTFYF